MAKAAPNNTRKAPPPQMTMDGIATQWNATLGAGTVVTGRQLRVDPPRMPFGVFPVDFATGGGLPLWQTACLWGPESGGKSTLAINAMAAAQNICWKCFHPLKYCVCSGQPLSMKSVYLDAEGTFDLEWARGIGSDPDHYYQVLADYGEQYIDVAFASIMAEDCGLMIVDSIAALVPIAELRGAAEDQHMGTQPRLIGRLVKGLKARLTREKKRDKPCTVIFINQMRKNLAVKFGSPEEQPGGHAMKHEFSLLLRCVQKSLTDADKARFHDKQRDKNLASRYSFSIRKAKVQTLTGVGEYVRINEDVPDTALRRGQVEDLNTLLTYAKIYGIVSKANDGWHYFEYKAKNLDQIKDVWRRSFQDKLLATQRIVRLAKDKLGEMTPKLETTDTDEEL